MGFIREPKGVDFIIQSDPLTEKERKEISQFIANYKLERTKLNQKKLETNTTNSFHKSKNT